MITRIGVAPRLSGHSTQSFQTHWAGSHAEAVAPLPGLVRYWQNHSVLKDGEPLLPWPGFDACSELDFPDIAVMDAAFAGPAYHDRVKPDEGRFVDKSAGGMMLCERQIVRGTVSPDTGVRLWRFLRLAPGQDAGDLRDTLAKTSPVEQAISQERFFALPQATTGRAAIFDAAEAFWFETPEAALSAMQSSAMRERMAGLASLVRGTEHLLAWVHPVTPKPA